MSVAVRLLVAAGTLAAGSWLGLGRPSAEQLRARLEATSTTTTTSAPASSASAKPEEKSVEFGPLPQQRDASSYPSISQWPALNEERSVQKAWMVAEGPQRTARRLVTLTFDDGPFLETTPVVLKLLARHKIHATFFVLGQYLDGDLPRDRATRRLLVRIEKEGHLIGNHTHDHLNLSNITHNQALDQIDRGAASIERATGKKTMLFRPPFGELDEFGRQAIKDRGLDIMLWSVDASDMTRTDSHQMFKELSQQLEYKEGGVVILHDIRFTSIAALRELLGWLDEHKWNPKEPTKPGYDVVDLPTYLRAVKDAPLAYENRDDLIKARDAAHAKHHHGPGDG